MHQRLAAVNEPKDKELEAPAAAVAQDTQKGDNRCQAGIYTEITDLSGPCGAMVIAA